MMKRIGRLCVEAKFADNGKWYLTTRQGNVITQLVSAHISQAHDGPEKALVIIVGPVNLTLGWLHK